METYFKLHKSTGQSLLFILLDFYMASSILCKYRLQVFSQRLSGNFCRETVISVSAISYSISR